MDTLLLRVAGQDKDGVPVRGVLLPEQKAGGQTEEAKRGGDQRGAGGAAEMRKKKTLVKMVLPRAFRN